MGFQPSSELSSTDGWWAEVDNDRRLVLQRGSSADRAEFWSVAQSCLHKMVSRFMCVSRWVVPQKYTHTHTLVQRPSFEVDLGQQVPLNPPSLTHPTMSCSERRRDGSKGKGWGLEGQIFEICLHTMRVTGAVFVLRCPSCHQPMLKTSTGRHPLFNHQQTPEERDIIAFYICSQTSVPWTTSK